MLFRTRLGSGGRLFLVLALSILNACGGDHGKDSETDLGNTGEAATISVLGSVQKGRVSGAQVRVFDASGALLASAQSDDAGAFDLLLPVNVVGPLQFVVAGGQYLDEATGNIRSLGVPLRAVLDFSPGQLVLTVTISPVTDIAARIAEIYSDDFIISQNSSDQFIETIAAVYAAFGLAGLDATNPAHDLSLRAFDPQEPAGRYGLILAAMSQLLASSERFNNDLGVLILSLVEDYQESGRFASTFQDLIRAIQLLAESMVAAGANINILDIGDMLAALEQANSANSTPSASPSAQPSPVPGSSPTPPASTATPGIQPTPPANTATPGFQPTPTPPGGSPTPSTTPTVTPVPSAVPTQTPSTGDLDGDGIPDAQDDDRDGDGISNDYELQANTDPDHASARPADQDVDGIPNQFDEDRDGDGVNNDLDRFPDDASEQTDADGDGKGDASDPDRDGDGTPNDLDAFPDDPDEQSDLDGDGIGDNSDPDRDGDGVSNADDYFPDNPTANSVPRVNIQTPKTLTTVGSSPIPVTGSVDDPSVTVTLNGVAVDASSGQFSANVSLQEGGNTIVARATDAQDFQGISTINVSLDKTPPYIAVQAPLPGSTVFQSPIAVSGLVNDIIRGTITDDDALVTVNAQQATVSNRSFQATGIALTAGENLIRIRASDAVGNESQQDFTVIYQPQLGRVIRAVSGDGQTGEVLSELASPLTVQLSNEGAPVSDQPVVFRVVQGDGLLNPGTDQQAQSAVVTSDENGEAAVPFQLGSHAGQGLHRVRARVVGFDGEVIFNASSTPAAANKLGVIVGNNQRGMVRHAFPSPLVVAATDAGSNLVQNALVRFEATQGGGVFENNQSSIDVFTDKDGRASALFFAGAEEGLDKQRVHASLIGSDASAGFTLSAFIPGDPGSTSISGLVLDNQDRPLPGVVVRIEGSSRQAVVADNGQFQITNVPIGPVHLLVEGSTAQASGEFPSLSFNLVTVPGIDNALPRPIYLVALDTDNALTVGPETVSLTLPDLPGFALTVFKDSVTFPNGDRQGLLSVTPVNSNKVPMPPPNGMQPQLVVTIQPHGVMFDPPAQLTLPNVDAYSPGAEVEMYSYDHDLEEFVTIGLGRVSKDGQTITSNPGVGVIKAGWHCGSPPGPAGCCTDCAPCYEASGSPCACTFIADFLAPQNKQDPQDCKLFLCDGSFNPVDEEMPEDQTKRYDCKTSFCQGGESVILPDETDKDPNNPCQTCNNGNVVNLSNDQSCGDGSPEQACLVCVDGECKIPDCDKSAEAKDVFEVGTLEDLLGPVAGFANKAIESVTDALDNSPWIKIDGFAPVAKGAYETGKKCCTDCTLRDRTPHDYSKSTVGVGLKGEVFLTPPNLGGAVDIEGLEMFGFAIIGSIRGSAAGLTLIGEVTGNLESTQSEICKELNCNSLALIAKLDLKAGPQLKGTVKAVVCVSSSNCDESHFTIAGAELEGGVTFNATVTGGWKFAEGGSSKCGGDCSGLEISPLKGVAELKGSAIISGIKRSKPISYEYVFKPTATQILGTSSCFGD